MNENQMQLIIKEKNLAVEQYNQSKLLIEKLEQELQLLRDQQPTSNNNIINIIQKEYSEVINVLRDKLKTAQDKCKKESSDNTRKDIEINVLTRRIEELNLKLKHTEKQNSDCGKLLKQEREKYLTLEKDFIATQSELLSLEKKYSCVKILEKERDKLIGENHKLSNDCNELEIALEICHQKMQRHEDELNQYVRCLEKFQIEKEILERNEKAEKEMNNELEKRIEVMNGTLKKLNEKLKMQDDLFKMHVVQLIEHYSIDEKLKESWDKDLNMKENANEDEQFLSKDEYYYLQTLFSSYKVELQNCVQEKQDLEAKLKMAVTNIEKYKVYIREANNMISSLEKKLGEQEKRMKNKISGDELRKYQQKMENTKIELQKQIQSQELLHKNDVDEYGFRRPDDFNYAQHEAVMSIYLTVLTERSRKWFNLLKDEKKLKRGSQLKRYVRKGIPSAYRAQVWSKICGVDEMKKKYGNDLYNRRLNTVLDSEVVQAIRTDLPRTFPENMFFVPSEGSQQELYRILFAFAADNTEVGYCQGLNYVAGLLLLVTKNEECTFWLLKALVEKILPDYYAPKMKGLMVDIEVFDRIISSKMPELYKHIKTLNIPWSCLIMKWFICLYAEVLPTETVLRVWDCVFYEGDKVLFRVGTTLINHHQKSLLDCTDFNSFTDFFKKMQTDIFVLDCHNFMKRVNSENKFITNRELEKLRKQVKLVKK